MESYPGLSEQVRIDAGEQEINQLKLEASDFVVLRLTLPDGTDEQLAIDAETFKKSFRGDADEVLSGAERAYFPPTAPETPRRRGRPRTGSEVSAGQKPKRDKELIAQIRAWARENGWPDLKDRGRIPLEAEAAWEAAHQPV